MHSCTRTVFMLSSYIVGYAAATASISNAAGRRAAMASHCVVMASSRDAPAPAATRGCSDSTVAKRSYVSFWSHVMSAFSCRPKMSGFGTMGYVRSSSRKSAAVSHDLQPGRFAETQIEEAVTNAIECPRTRRILHHNGGSPPELECYHNEEDRSVNEPAKHADFGTQSNHVLL